MKIPYTKYKKLLKAGKIVQELTMDGYMIYNYEGNQYTASFEAGYIILKKIRLQLDMLTLIYEWQNDFADN